MRSILFFLAGYAYVRDIILKLKKDEAKDRSKEQYVPNVTFVHVRTCTFRTFEYVRDVHVRSGRTRTYVYVPNAQVRSERVRTFRTYMYVRTRSYEYVRERTLRSERERTFKYDRTSTIVRVRTFRYERTSTFTYVHVYERVRSHKYVPNVHVVRSYEQSVRVHPNVPSPGLDLQVTNKQRSCLFVTCRSSPGEGTLVRQVRTCSYDCALRTYVTHKCVAHLCSVSGRSPHSQRKYATHLCVAYVRSVRHAQEQAPLVRIVQSLHPTKSVRRTKSVRLRRSSLAIRAH